MSEYKLISNRVFNLKGSYKYDAALDAYGTTIHRCVLEPKNRYDNKAIKVVNDESKTIGYLADGSKYRETVRKIIESGKDVYAIVVENTLYDEKYGDVKVQFATKN